MKRDSPHFIIIRVEHAVTLAREPVMLALRTMIEQQIDLLPANHPLKDSLFQFFTLAYLDHPKMQEIIDEVLAKRRAHHLPRGRTADVVQSKD